MSAAQTKKEGSEVGWGGLESLGLSQKELVLAEALQMEYDALSRLKQDTHGPGASQTPNHSKTPNPTAERPQPTPSQPSLAATEGSLLGGLSASDLSLNQPGVSHCPLSTPGGVLPFQQGYNNESLFILEGSEISKYRDCSVSSLRNSFGSGSEFLSRGSTPLPDDIPPTVPPRCPIIPSAGSEKPSFFSAGSLVSHNVNLFLPDVDQPKLTSAELNYDSSGSLSQLNNSQTGPRGRRANGDQLGKPVARSKTLPPQVPPRTYIPVIKSNKDQWRLSADPVRTCEFIGSLS